MFKFSCCRTYHMIMPLLAPIAVVELLSNLRVVGSWLKSGHEPVANTLNNGVSTSDTGSERPPLHCVIASSVLGRTR